MTTTTGKIADEPRDVLVLGSTGSIGTQVLDVVAARPHRFRVVGLAAGGADVALLASAGPSARGAARRRRGPGRGRRPAPASCPGSRCSPVRTPPPS